MVLETPVLDYVSTVRGGGVNPVVKDDDRCEHCEGNPNTKASLRDTSSHLTANAVRRAA